MLILIFFSLHILLVLSLEYSLDFKYGQLKLVIIYLHLLFFNFDIKSFIIYH